MVHRQPGLIAPVQGDGREPAYPSLSAIVAENVALREQRDRARAWAKRGGHHRWCSISSRKKCDCGLDVAMADEPPPVGKGGPE